MYRSRRKALPVGWEALVEEIVKGSTKMRHRLCEIEPEMHDGETDDDIEAAVVICTRCPSLEKCRQWALSPDSGELLGVVGGELFLEREAAS
jgi:hypothetical protein